MKTAEDKMHAVKSLGMKAAGSQGRRKTGVFGGRQVLLLLAFFWLSGQSHCFGQEEIPDPPPLPVIPKLLNFWQFDDTNLLGSVQAFPPKTATNLNLVASWETNAVEISSPGAILQFQVVETNNSKNLTCDKGTYFAWLMPYWSTGAGAGPGSYARIFEVGTYTTNASIGWLSLYFDPHGSNVFFSGQTNGASGTFLTAPVSLVSNTWTFFALLWTSSNSALFTNGVVAGTGSGAAYFPNSSVRSNGFCLGGDATGTNLINGQIDWVKTYNGPVEASWVRGYYNLVLQKYGDSGMFNGGQLGGTYNPCPTNVPVYLTNLVCGYDISLGWTNSFTIAGGTNGILYDVFRTTNLLGTNAINSQWTWLGRGYTCYTYTLSNQPNSQAFYLLAHPLGDADGDGMPSAWEIDHGLNPFTNDANDDPDADGLTNFQEYQAGTNPHDSWLFAWGNNSCGQCDAPTNIFDAVAVGGGILHSVALRSNGTVAAWGDNSRHQTEVPTNLTNAVAVAAAAFQNVAVRADGSVTAWGSWFANVGFPPIVIPGDLTNIVAVAAGADHDIALRRDGTVAVWGYTNEIYNTNPSGLTNVKAVAAGFYHNVALLSNGTVTAWGQNGSGLGVTNVPVGLGNVIAISAGQYHTLALKADGTVSAWGGGTLANFGQSTVPFGLSNVVAISAGGNHSLALRKDGSVVAWGDLASPTFLHSNLVAFGSGGTHGLAVLAGRLTPLILTQPTNQCALVGTYVTLVADGRSRSPFSYQWQLNGTNLPSATNATLILTNAQADNQGTYRLCLSNSAGFTYSQEATFGLGLRPVLVSWTQPQEFTLLFGSNLTLNVEATNANGCYLPLVHGWFLNGVQISFDTNLTISAANATSGVLSNFISNLAAATNVSWTIHVAGEGTPIWWGNITQAWDYLPGVTNTIALAGGGGHNLALQENGTVLAWGINDSGQTNIPGALSNVIAIAAGAAHSLALRSNGTVVAWGGTNFGQTNVPVSLTNAIAISAGGNQSLALRSDGTLVQWGQTNVAPPANLINVAAVASGTNFHLALLSNSTVVAWGTNDFGQTNVPSNLSNVVAIAAGGAHALALRENGSVVAWGSHASGETNVPTNLTNAMAIAAGDAHSLALRSDGTVLAWGDNTYGQTNSPPLVQIKLIAAGGHENVASVFSPLVQYPITLAKDLLLVYNTNSVDSSNICAYYLQHRPLVGGANVLGVGCTTNETFLPEDYTNIFAAQIKGWLIANPTKRPQYVILFPDIPSRVNINDTPGVYSDDSFGPPVSPSPQRQSVQYQLNAWCATGWHPFVTAINMGDTNACRAYIDKLEYRGTNVLMGRLIISASADGYGNANYLIDDIKFGVFTSNDPLLGATNGLALAGTPSGAVKFVIGVEELSPPPHLTTGTNVAGYASWGVYTSLGGDYATDGGIRWQGNSGWWIIETVESFNGRRDASGQGSVTKWFSNNAFGGMNFSNSPIGAVSHVDEPSPSGINDPQKYFGLWETGRMFAICAWNSRRTFYFQAVGDPFVKK